MSENYYLLDDMERYNPNFKREKWENKSKVETIDAFKEIYKALDKPIDVTTWIRMYEADEKYIYAKAQGNQVCFVRDNIAPLFYKKEISNEEWLKNHKNLVKVVSTHYSKSVKLPVYNLKFEELGLEITMRNNFYDWKISIESVKDIDIDFGDLFDGTLEINYLYCEGMGDINKTFGSFSDNKKTFTVEIEDDYRVFTFMYLLSNYLKQKSVKQ